MASPNPRNGHVIGAQLGRQATAAPLGGSILRVTTGPLQYARFEPCCISAHFAPRMTGYQPSLVAVHAQDSEKREIVRDIMKDNGLEVCHYYWWLHGSRPGVGPRVRPPWSAACAAGPRWRRSSSGQLQTLPISEPKQRSGHVTCRRLRTPSARFHRLSKDTVASMCW